MTARERMADGIAPRDAVAFLEELRSLHADFERATGDLCRTYDAEVARVYGYTAWRPTSGPEELAKARERWWDAVRAFRDKVATLKAPGESQP
ncbi:MAG TPA: hypothetical protein VEB22_11355 [Phycisphaerales bacterium]|nr:hypothetical protein [Phycisphaerales bacterium]